MTANITSPSVDLRTLNLDVNSKVNHTPTKTEQIKTLISAVKSSEPIMFKALDETRLILNDIVMNKKISKDLISKSDELTEDKMIMVSNAEIRDIIINNYFDNFLKFICSNTNYMTFIEMCKSTGYKLNRELTVMDFKTCNSRMVYSNSDLKKVNINSEIFRQEMWVTDNVVPKYMTSCMKHIAIQLWMQSSIDEKIQIIENNYRILNTINSVQFDKDNPYWVFKLHETGKYNEFMTLAGYEQNYDFGNNIEAWKIKSNAWESCQWVKNNFNHKTPIIVSKFNYCNDNNLTQVAAMLNVWRRLQTHKNSISLIVEKLV